MPNVWPESLIVLMIVEETPKYLLSTDPIMALVLDAENIPIPRPIIAKAMIIMYKLVASLMNERINKPSDNGVFNGSNG
ncbi:hypothetical protein MBMB1_0559 [Methanobacterium sp. MB1]|jgi:hypothetical protein|uniref:hypothetical protein n=1 Tax=uncultured Methanobacterium sp. TaxID=176306 RepID=UPI0003C93772|nr:hypothetical protein [uncultured Methanobacterium sp.]CDG64666.1 hypothetical protein MBMB1_0559 [Methanobacterium sp. MB1]